MISDEDIRKAFEKDPEDSDDMVLTIGQVVALGFLCLAVGFCGVCGALTILYWLFPG